MPVYNFADVNKSKLYWDFAIIYLN